MTEVGIRELKNHLSSYLRRVEKGQSMYVTDRGKKIALLLPLRQPEAPVQLHGMVEEGIASWNGGKPRGLERPVKSRGKTASDIVLDARQ